MFPNIEVIILCGGRGSRLQSVLPGLPKPLAPIADKPFLTYQIEHLIQCGFSNFCLSSGYLADHIEKFCQKFSNCSVNIRISCESVPLGTGGATRLAIQSSKFKKFLVLNGDTFFAADFSLLCTPFPLEDRFIIGLRYHNESSRYGAVILNESSQIIKFSEKQPNYDACDCYINAGAYVFSREFLKLTSEGTFSLENDFFPNIIPQGKLHGIALGGPFIDIGIPKDFERAQSMIPIWAARVLQPCLFLDRDGIVNKDFGYVHQADQVELVDGIVELIDTAKKNNFLVIIVTNQAGIAKGKFSQSEYLACAEHIEMELANRGASVNTTYYCPYHLEHGIGKYRRNSLARKPHPGMILKSMEDFPIDIRRSYMVGDKVSDCIRLKDLRSLIVDNQQYSLVGLARQVKIFKNLIEIRHHIFNSSGSAKISYKGKQQLNQLR